MSDLSYRDLDRLSDAAARGALTMPAERLGVTYDEDAVHAIIADCGGYPYFIQDYGRVLWREVDQAPIGLEDYHSVREIILAELDRRFFKDRFESATDSEQRYLVVMAGLSDPPYRTAEIARAGYRTQSSGSEPRAGLLKKDLIWSPRRGLVDFTVPQFAQYIWRNHRASEFEA